MSETKYIKEYAILGRYRKDTKFHTIMGGPLSRITDKAEAEKLLKKFRADAQKEILGNKSVSTRAGLFSVTIPRDADYDIVEFRLVEREVSNWVTLDQIETIDHTTEGDRDVIGMMENGARVLWSTEPQTAADDVHQMLEYATGKYLLTLKRLQDGCLHVTNIQKITNV